MYNYKRKSTAFCGNLFAFMMTVEGKALSNIVTWTDRKGATTAIVH